MSTQACNIKGYGYKFNYDDLLFEHIKDLDLEYDLLEVIALNGSYYNTRDLKGGDRVSPLRVYSDGMNGEFKYVLYVTEAHYIENTHGDNYWKNKYRNDDYVKKYAKQHIETFLNRKIDRDIENVDFEYWC